MFTDLASTIYFSFQEDIIKSNKYFFVEENRKINESLASGEKDNTCESGYIEGTEDTCFSFSLTKTECENSKEVKSVKANVRKKSLESKDKREEAGTLKRKWQRTDTNDGNDDGERRTRSKSRKLIETTKDTNNITNQTKNDESKKTAMENAESNEKNDVNKSTVSKLFVHSQWLSVQSSYFKSLFYSGLKETYSKEVVMKIYEHELQAHLTLIEAMYKIDVLKDKDYRLIVQVLNLAHKYDIPLLVTNCKYVLLSTTPNLEMCEYILKETQHLSEMGIVYEILEKFLVKEFTPIDRMWTMDKFTDLSKPALRLLLGSNHLPTKSENTIFVALIKWVHLNLSWREQIRCDLLNVLRFEFMSIDFLYDVVQNDSIAKRMLGFDQYLLNGLAYHGFSMLRRELLEPQPKKRPLMKDSDPTFSWVIDDELEKKLAASPGKRFYSDIFWHKGYKMRLFLKYCDVSNCCFFLTVCDVRDKACLHASYRAESNLFACRTLQTGKNKYTSKSSSRGYKTIERNPMLRGEGFTIDVWVTVY